MLTKIRDNRLIILEHEALSTHGVHIYKGLLLTQSRDLNSYH